MIGKYGFSSEISEYLKPNPLDKHLKLPTALQSRKNVPKLLRELMESEENEDITDIFRNFVCLATLEDMIFKNTKNWNYIPIRLAITYNNPNTLKKKIIGKISKYMEGIGTSHLSIQIGKKKKKKKKK